MGWFRLASHLGVPLQELQEKTTSTEYIEWMEFLERDINSFHREDYFLANLALEVRRSWVANPNQEKLKTFLLRFSRENETPTTGPLSSKQIWCSLLGVNPNV